MSVDSLYETMGLHRIVELDPAGRAQLEYMAKPGMCHSGGVVQGGFVTGWIERRGRKTAFLEGRLLDEAGNVLAKGTSTVTLFDRAKVEASAKAAIGG